MTPKQHALWEFIKDYTNQNGYSPSFEEMKDFMGLKSKSGIHRLLKGLENQNVVSRTPHQHRGVALPDIQEISNENIENINTNENEKSIKEKKVIIDIYNNKIIGRSNTN